MLDRIRGDGDRITDGICAKPALYTRMRAFIRTKMLVSFDCRQAIAVSADAPTKASALLMYNRVYDRANLGDENAIRLLGDVAHVTGVAISLGGKLLGPKQYVPVAQAA